MILVNSIPFKVDNYPVGEQKHIFKDPKTDDGMKNPKKVELKLLVLLSLLMVYIKVRKKVVYQKLFLKMVNQ